MEKDIEELTLQLFKKLYLKNKNNGQMSQGKVLKILYKKGDMSQKEMQDRLQIKSGSMSELVNKLENKQLIIRLKDENDRRKTILHLTDLGQKDVENYTKQRHDDTAHFFDVLNDEEKEQYKNICMKLLKQGKKNSE